jgi:hypothetical protein
MDNMLYKCNMAIALSMFFFGYGISLSGHLLYKLFDDGSGSDRKDDDE